MNTRGVSFHEFALPGYPASHACVRLLEDDARWLHAWVEQCSSRSSERSSTSSSSRPLAASLMRAAGFAGGAELAQRGTIFGRVFYYRASRPVPDSRVARS